MRAVRGNGLIRSPVSLAAMAIQAENYAQVTMIALGRLQFLTAWRKSLIGTVVAAIGKSCLGERPPRVHHWVARTMVATPAGADSIAFDSSGIRTRTSASRLDVARRTMTAIENAGRFC